MSEGPRHANGWAYFEQAYNTMVKDAGGTGMSFQEMCAGKLGTNAYDIFVPLWSKFKMMMSNSSNIPATVEVYVIEPRRDISAAAQIANSLNPVDLLNENLEYGSAALNYQELPYEVKFNQTFNIWWKIKKVMKRTLDPGQTWDVSVFRRMNIKLTQFSILPGGQTGLEIFFAKGLTTCIMVRYRGPAGVDDNTPENFGNLSPQILATFEHRFKSTYAQNSSIVYEKLTNAVNPLMPFTGANQRVVVRTAGNVANAAYTA